MEKIRTKEAIVMDKIIAFIDKTLRVTSEDKKLITKTDFL